jgi:hypothetical protein
VQKYGDADEFLSKSIQRGWQSGIEDRRGPSLTLHLRSLELRFIHRQKWDLDLEGAWVQYLLLSLPAVLEKISKKIAEVVTYLFCDTGYDQHAQDKK